MSNSLRHEKGAMNRFMLQEAKAAAVIIKEHMQKVKDRG